MLSVAVGCGDPGVSPLPPEPPVRDAGVTDAGPDDDAGVLDAGTSDDAGTGDAGTANDAGTSDAGTSDAGTADDAGTVDPGDPDAGTADDAGTSDDAGTADDAGTSDDAGVVDGGTVAEVPSPPEAVMAMSGDGTVRVFWMPAEDNGSPLTGYTVTASPGGASETVAPDVLEAQLTGLTNGTAYTFTVVAMNAVGPSTPSQPSEPVTPAGRPGAPSGVVATAEVRGATVSWTAPETNGSPITGYAVDVQPAVEGASVDVTGQQAHVTGLANGTAYTFTVRASNAAGEGPASTASTAITTPDVPGAPLDLSAQAEDGATTVSWSAPTSDGGNALTGYTVTLQPGDVTQTLPSTQTQTHFTELTNGTAYTLHVVALNAVGTGPEATETVTPVGPPAAPTDVVAVAGAGQLTLTWTAPTSNGGSPVTAYRVTPSVAGVAGAAVTVGPQTQAVLTGLPRGTTYTVTVAAVNAVGTSADSQPSAEVTTPDVPGAPRTPLATALGKGRVRVDWALPESDGGSALTRFSVRASPGGRTVNVAGSATSAILSGLEGGTHYTFTVQATNAVGDSELSPACDATTPCGLSLGGWPKLPVTGVNAVAAGDFNEDGLPDLGITQSSGVAVMVGDGVGGFTRQTPLTVNTATTQDRAHAADFNEDGHLDLLFLSSISGTTTVSIAFGDGKGRFTSRKNLDIPVVQSVLAVLDFNDDGRLDLVAPSSTSTVISLFPGDGTGGFGPRQDVPFPEAPRAATMGDFNGDGRQDLFVTHNTFSATVLLADGAGGFQPGQVLQTELYATQPRSVDLDRDGKLDVVFLNQGATSLGVAMGDGTGRFAAPMSFPVADAPGSLELTDVDGDGHEDAVVTHGKTVITVRLGDGTGGFPVRKDLPTLESSHGVAVGDFDGDGHRDIAVASTSDGLSLLKGRGQGAFLTRLDVAAVPSPAWTATGDFNGDGVLDLAVTSRDSAGVAVKLGDGQGGFGVSRNLSTASIPSAVVAVDLNQDGKLDLVTANQNGTPGPTLNGNVTVWLGNGLGNFARKDFTTGRVPMALLAEDFTGDGRVDLVTANNADNTVSLLAGDGFGGFAAAVTTDVATLPIALASADLDGDGRKDLLLVSYDGTVEPERNLGGGTFARQPSVSVGSRPRAIALAEFNGDGRVDAAVANSNGSSVSVLLGTTPWGLTVAQTLTTGNTPQGVAAADFDGDGKVDLAVSHNNAASAAHYVRVFPGTGTGSFGAPVDFSTTSSVSALTRADVNGDGREDLITANSGRHYVSVFLNFCL
ncbi:VCBS repeat-containing protein [Corallococcus macrosporus]|uniref:VCBS repeat-containing protein n=1 Tax=Corallococcus macrosporus TaxID=35 RepID=A0ABS3DPM2_9BACT|nr:FG-GAP-like repeat-containing protein [Corallococcus macrosporus]MBN8233293.1 VCBS repeat-containing protein [Corallococcus macrosporus]